MLTLPKAPDCVVSLSDFTQKHKAITTGFVSVLLLLAGFVLFISCLFYDCLVQFNMVYLFLETC